MSEMKSKSNKSSLAMAYGSKKSAMSRKGCPNCGMSKGGCVCMAEGGQVDSEKPLHTSPSGPNHELDASLEETERSEFGYGESSESASQSERDMPSLNGAEESLSQEIMRDRSRRGMSKTQGEAEAPQGKVSSYEDDLDNNDSLKDKKVRPASHGHVPESDRPKRSKPSVSEESLSERNDSSVLHMAQGGSVSYEDDSEMNESSKVGSLQGAIDASSQSSKSPLKDEVDPDAEDGRESRGLNLEPVHEMTDPKHDQESASKDSDYEEHDDSLVGEILRERRLRRRGM